MLYTLQWVEYNGVKMVTKVEIQSLKALYKMGYRLHVYGTNEQLQNHGKGMMDTVQSLMTVSQQYINFQTLKKEVDEDEQKE